MNKCSNNTVWCRTVTLTRSLDAFTRLAVLGVCGTSATYSYDGENRLSDIVRPEAGAAYRYTNGFVAGYTLTLTNGNVFCRAVGRDPHRQELIVTVSNLFNGVFVSGAGYGHDLLGRRTGRIDTVPGSSVTNSFGYNARSEVTNAVQGADHYAYCYDSIGNRMATTENTKNTEYLANELNQYTQISVPSVSSVVNPTYDADGNMRWDGRMWHTWDAENRLTRSEPGWDGATNGAVMVDNRYDYRHRRCSKTVRRLSGRGAGYPFDPSQGGTWDVVEARTFIYDGWNLTAEVVVDAQAGTTNVTRYLWGPDVSGTLQGAGGVGGLLAVIRSDGTFFPCYDANGNVTDYVDVNGTVRAHYEYSPFGETIAQSGDLADTFTFRFSTKYWDAETRSYYYGYRHYAPKFGCWFNRDPIGERGGRNLYGFVGNDPVGKRDKWGLFVLGRVDSSPRIMGSSEYEGIWAGVLVFLTKDEKDKIEASGGAKLLHRKFTQIRVASCGTGDVIKDEHKAQFSVTEISPDGASVLNWPLTDGSRAVYYNVASLKGYGGCVKGYVIVKAQWFLFIGDTMNHQRGGSSADGDAGGNDSEHGATNREGWPTDIGAYVSHGSLSIEVKLECPNKFDGLADGRGEWNHGLFTRSKGDYDQNREEGSPLLWRGW